MHRPNNFLNITPLQNIGEKCQVCSKKLQSSSHTIQCRNCLVKYHSKCVNVNKSGVLCELWCCPYCAQAIFPYNHFDDDDDDDDDADDNDDDDDFHSAVIECMLDCSFRLHEINNKVFTPFEINDGFDTPFVDIDPNYQYYTNFHHSGNLNCDYYFEDEFRCKLHKIQKSQLYIFQLNIKAFLSIRMNWSCIWIH